MKDFFIGWIIIQLVVIGMAGIVVHNGILDGTYVCEFDQKKQAPVWVGVAFPLANFIPESGMVKKYCGY